MKIKQFKLGMKVLFKEYFYRDYVYSEFHQTRKIWLVCKFPKEIKRGIVIGIRTLQNGHIDRSDDGNVWIMESTVRCVLVVTDIRRNPYKVPLDNITEDLNNETT